MRMSKLDAVNLILRKMGEIPVPSIDEPYPTLTIALPAIDEAQTIILQEGFWFNKFDRHVLQPEVSGEILTAPNVLKFFPEDTKYKWEGTRIVMADTGSILINAPVAGVLVINKDFETLPEVARYAIAYWAAAATYESDIGPDDTWRMLAESRDLYLGQLGADHTVTRQANSRQRKVVKRWLRALHR